MAQEEPLLSEYLQHRFLSFLWRAEYDKINRFKLAKKVALWHQRRLAFLYGLTPGRFEYRCKFAKGPNYKRGMEATPLPYQVLIDKGPNNTPRYKNCAR